MQLGWFNATEARNFGAHLAEMLATDLSKKEKSKREFSAAKRARLLQKVFVQVRQFKQTRKLNFYKKAKLGNSFKWKLLELGFEPGLVDELTHELMLRMSD